MESVLRENVLDRVVDGGIETKKQTNAHVNPVCTNETQTHNDATANLPAKVVAAVAVRNNNNLKTYKHVYVNMSTLLQLLMYGHEDLFLQETFPFLTENPRKRKRKNRKNKGKPPASSSVTERSDVKSGDTVGGFTNIIENPSTTTADPSG